jgi:hypothetical protein
MAEDLMDKVFSFFAGEGLTDEKQNMLKGIAKELNQSKYAKYFRIRTEETDSSFLSFLFSVYKTIYPIKMFMKDETKMAQLRHFTVESCIDPNIKETINRLDPAYLESKLKSTNGEEVVTAIQTDINLLINQFDHNHRTTVNHRYELASELNKLVNYNFPGFFKKFDAHFIDGSFLVEPKFPAVKTILIIDQMADFLTATHALRPDEDWTGLFNILKKCEGFDLVPMDAFINMLKTLREIHTSKIVELMIQYTLRNPVWQFKQAVINETIGDIWLEAKKSEAYAFITRINNTKKAGQISALTKQIFESTDFIRMENYNVPLSETYRKRHLDYFVYAEGLNYLKAFMNDYLEKEVKELCDILLIRGQWTNNTMAREMSDAFHSVEDTAVSINDLDTVMSEDGADGSRLRAAMLRIDRDPTQARYINSIVTKVNEEAIEIINEAVQALIIVGKHLKNLIEDIQKKHPELLINWREINLASKEPINQRMISTFKKINYFVQLMHLCTQ